MKQKMSTEKIVYEHVFIYMIFIKFGCCLEAHNKMHIKKTKKLYFHIWFKQYLSAVYIIYQSVKSHEIHGRMI